jgi:hypothetical protein
MTGLIELGTPLGGMDRYRCAGETGIPSEWRRLGLSP